MDSRTAKIRRLENKLSSARDFIRDVAIQCVEMEDGKFLSKSYWGKKAIIKLEYTKESN